MPNKNKLDAARLKRNAAKLAKLEKDWSTLGSVRDITFDIFIGAEHDARVFAERLKEHDFEVGVHRNIFRRWSVVATRAMEATAASVTYWEEWIEAKATAWIPSSEGGWPAQCWEWRYPERRGPSFSLNGSTSQISMTDRAEILFGKTLCYDRLQRERNARGSKQGSEPNLFRLVPSVFLNQARRRRPTAPEPTAAKFAQWLYSLYSDALGSDQDRQNGRDAEEHILAARRRAYTSADESLLTSTFPEWSLVHNGMGFNGNALNHFVIEELKVGGQALRVLPDLVYRNNRTGEVIIVEIKHSRMDIPENLWPNIWGQLWCYSQLPLARAAPKVTVVGEVWADEWHHRQPTQVCLRASVRRDPRARAYDRFFRALFDIYRGIG